jgi:beta-lactamase class D
MQHFINTVNYGNQNIDGKIDLFWLKGPLKISPNEQIEFLIKLYSKKLPFSQRNMDIVNNILKYEEGNNYILRAKTGWAARFNPHVGWFVGYLEKNNNVYFFVTNVETENPAKGFPSREEITKQIFKELDLL